MHQYTLGIAKPKIRLQAFPPEGGSFKIIHQKFLVPPKTKAKFFYLHKNSFFEVAIQAQKKAGVYSAFFMCFISP